MTNTQKKLEEKIVTLEESIKNNNSMHSVSTQYPLLSCLLIQIQKLMDEHSELQLEFNSQDKKLKDLQGENDRLVNTVIIIIIITIIIIERRSIENESRRS